MQNTTQKKNQTPNGTYTDFRAIIEEAKNAELVEEKEKKLCSKNLIIHGVEESSCNNKNGAIKSDSICVNNFIAALKVTSTAKSASRIGLLAQDKNRPTKVVMNAKEERNRILSNLRNLKGVPEYKTISVTEDYTITERRMIKDWSNKVKEKNKNEFQILYGECKVVQKTYCDSRGSRSRQKQQIADHGKKVFKQLQYDQEADYDKNYKKLFFRDHLYPLSKSMPAINIMYTNADQFTAMKNSELLEFVERKKHHIVAINEVKPNIPREWNRTRLCNSWLLFASSKS